MCYTYIMNAITIDTHAVVKELMRRGFNEEQAEGVVDAIESIDLSDLATKRDILELKSDILKWMFGQTALIVALIKFL